MKKMISVIGARPQFIKHAPMQLQLQKYYQALTIHTGQHYDKNMSDVFFNELDIPQPDYLFDIGGSKSQGEQTGIMMTEIERVCLKEKPDAVLIYGDTNSTLAGALVSVKLGIPYIHIEAGLRSYNRQMPEEINRIIADEFATLLFCPTSVAVSNLKKEGINHENIIVCGDVMCDMLRLISPKTTRLLDQPYYFATLHRPYNTDSKARLLEVLNALNSLDRKTVFPMHPRTVARMESYGINSQNFSNVEIIEPVGYVESISWQRFAEAIITDSGGMQKEAYMLGKRCVTIRSETEWIETLENGWNTLVFNDLSKIKDTLSADLGEYNSKLYGDGNAAEAIVKKINEYFK